MIIFSYGFMQRAFLAALLISIALPLLGNFMVLRRLAPVGDALSHGSLFGIALGLCFGFNPVLGAVMAALFSSFAMEFIRTAFSKYSEIATSIIMSLGVGLAAILSGFIKSSSDLSSYMFGSIVAVSGSELIIVAVITIAVVLMVLVYYRELLYISFDEESAIIAGVKHKRVNLIFTFLMALTVAVSAKTVGALLISTLMVIPTACAMQISKSFKTNILLSIGFALFFTTVGLLVSSVFDLRPGGVIAVLGVICLVIIILFKGARNQ